jgi:hypothetical protein
MRVMGGMWTLIRNGGYVPMSFILLFGVLALGAAFFFALRAERRTLGFIKSMAMATLFSTLAASCADVGATLYGAEKAFDPTKSYEAETRSGPPSAEQTEAAALPRVIHIVIEGFAESTSPGIVGFSFLALTWMLVAVGRRRLDERADAR